jgi:hypothetical protein
VAPLSAYAACHRELALRRRLPLATLDAELLAAMTRCGVAPAVLASYRNGAHDHAGWAARSTTT